MFILQWACFHLENSCFWLLLFSVYESKNSRQSEIQTFADRWDLRISPSCTWKKDPASRAWKPLSWTSTRVYCTPTFCSLWREQATSFRDRTGGKNRQAKYSKRSHRRQETQEGLKDRLESWEPSPQSWTLANGSGDCRKPPACYLPWLSVSHAKITSRMASLLHE